MYSRADIERYFDEEGIKEKTPHEVVRFLIAQTSEEQIMEILSSDQEDIGVRPFYTARTEKINGLPIYDHLVAGTRYKEVAGLASIFERDYVSKGSRVLDIGCATGLTSVLFGQAVGNKGIVTGIDICPEMVAIANERAKRRDLQNTRFLVGDMNNLSNVEGNYDLLLCLNTFSEGERDGTPEEMRLSASRRLEGFKKSLATEGKIVLSFGSYSDEEAEHWRIFLESCGFRDVKYELFPIKSLAGESAFTTLLFAQT